METKFGERGKLEIFNSTVRCFLGKKEKFKSSEEIWRELKDKEKTKMFDTYIFESEHYKICNPIPEKNISIITSNGKKYKSTIYFLDDIKNIIKGFKMTNPCYLLEGRYTALTCENDYIEFLFENNSNEIKDVEKETIDYTELEDSYKSFNIIDTNILGNINKNIHLYSKIYNIGKEKYYITNSRALLNIKLNKFFASEKRDEINDVIYGIFGNYASGKSFFLIYYNYISNFPSLYLNLKGLKNAFKTKGFSNLLNNELIILFKKLNKTYDDYKNFIESFFPYGDRKFYELILLIIEKIKKEKAVIIFDQYQEEIFIGENFIKEIKKILFSESSKIKVIISSSMNDGSIREAYLNIILNNIESKNEKEKKEKKEKEDNGVKEKEEKEKEKIQKEEIENQEKEEEKVQKREKVENDNKTNNYIPYHFLERLVDIEEIKKNIKNINKQDDKVFNDNLQIFSFLPLYYDLCKQNIDNLEEFNEKTKKRIEEKILNINKNEKFNLTFFDNIRKMIDNEITKDDLQFYSKYIPFKYFYIEKNSTNLILRTHFQLVKDVWNTIIMNNTVDLFDGEIKYDGNVIGSLLELNLIINIKNKVIPLDVDNFVKVDTIANFGCIIESDTDNYQNKNIFITQNNQNGPSFDMAYIKGKNLNSPKLIFIQVKKSFSDNKVTKEGTKIIFEEKQNNFMNIFGFIPERKDINLVYITLFNNQIQQAILEHDYFKNHPNKKVSDLGNDINSTVYSVNRLHNFCKAGSILLYYYDPKSHLFYLKNENKFNNSELDLLKDIKNELNYDFNVNYLSVEYENNKMNIPSINLQYQTYLKNKRKRSFSFEIDGFDFEIVFKFAETYFKNVKIINYIDLHKSHTDCQYYNLSKNEAIICLKMNAKNKYEVASFIYNEYFIKVEKNNLIKPINKGLDRDNDYLVGISFDSINEQLKKFFLISK